MSGDGGEGLCYNLAGMKVLALLTRSSQMGALRYLIIAWPGGQSQLPAWLLLAGVGVGMVPQFFFQWLCDWNRMVIV